MELMVRNITIGKGMPKICVPIVGKNDEDVLYQIDLCQTLPYDFIELRADCYHDILKFRELLIEIRQLLDCPILFTCRSKSEGGNSLLDNLQYKDLLKEVIESRLVDLIDIEINKSNKMIYELVECAKKYDVKIVMSYHNFEKTPSTKDMIDILEKMEVMGADILKIAVMPLSKKDVVSLMDTSLTMSSRIDKPLIMISMSELGKITRVAGELIGSAVTFASASYASAPGQINATELKLLLESIHR